jgi:NAD(P)-dependent dehydrogenase (short-subunit alcohol dehydrogenase family)
VDAITADGGKARFVAADLTQPAELDGLAEQAGQVDILVNNAGIAWFVRGVAGTPMEPGAIGPVPRRILCPLRSGAIGNWGIS